VAAELLAEVAGILPGGPVYVVAHSMGNRVLMGGMVRLWSDDPGKRHAFREIVLAAPDVDQDTFRLLVAPRILNTGPRFTLYASKGDLALQTATFLQGGKRLGFGGDALFVAQGMDSVDASAVTKEFFSLNHSYFGDKTNVLSDLFLLIRQGLEPARRPNLKRLTVPAGQAWTF
jgi:esterase/lipase superfamily enzyme